jgi:DNA-binding beta-propeller fold protein YncE
MKPRVVHWTLPLLIAIGVPCGSGSFAMSAPFEQGDIFVVAGNRVVHVAAKDTQQTLIVELPSSFHPMGIDVSLPTDLYVTDCCHQTGQAGRILRVDAVSGSYSIVAEGGFLNSPRDIAVLPDGDLAVADPAGVMGIGAILKVDPISLTQDILVSGLPFRELVSVTLGAPGELFFLDAGGWEGGVNLPDAVYRLDLATLDTTLVSRGGLLQQGQTINYAEGALYVPQFNGDGPYGSIIRLDPAGGAQTIVTSGDLLRNPRAATRRSEGCLVVLEPQMPGFNEQGIVCVDPASGEQSRLANYGLLWGVMDQVVYKGGLTPARVATWGSIKARYR